MKSISSISYSKLNRKLQPFVLKHTDDFTIEDWTLDKKITPSMVDFAAEKVGGDVKIKVFPRRMVREVWRHEMNGEQFLLKPYSFRAFAKGNEVVLFDDSTETNSSLLWLLLHEVGHIWVTRTPKLRKQFRSKILPSGYMTSDSAHESAPEEQFANMMADAWYKEYSGQSGSFHRLWWRDRVLGKKR